MKNRTHKEYVEREWDIPPTKTQRVQNIDRTYAYENSSQNRNTFNHTQPLQTHLRTKLAEEEYISNLLGTIRCLEDELYCERAKSEAY